ncbi:hydrolase [Roseimaritima ulvae]|uniref:Carboxypeptidase G2 n=1 Tax=Roseimaritima ulvae TaxID=980254 RepID=A0A5B9QLK1_9BACT|nr:hydrolase [Roseimaritima ulvae]QEG39824.1 Carboxypeptidase G2 precursor [Roseimaritima ulvae]
MTESNQALLDAHAWIAKQQTSVSDRLQRWCEQNSGSYHPQSLKTMAEVLVDDLSSWGLPVERVKLPNWEELDDVGQLVSHSTGPGLLWHHLPQADHRVLLLIHYDTVYSPDPPPAIRRVGERLVAPGAADAKGGIAVLHLALAALQRFEVAPNLGWSVVLNPDEEIGSPASRDWFASLADGYDFGMVFEPALPGGAWVADRKGSGNWSFLVQGRSAHAGRNPEQGRNAIVQAAALVQALDALNDRAHGRTVNVGRIQGGGPLNRVPDVAVVRVNVRITESDDEARIESRFRELASNFSGDGFRCSLFGSLHAPVKHADKYALLLRQRMQAAAEKVSRPVQWQDTGGACDGSKLAAFGLPNVDTLGPTGDHLHSPAEYCQLDSIVPAAQTIVQALHDFAAEPLRWPTRAMREQR